jgi:hypothetical protein
MPACDNDKPLPAQAASCETAAAAVRRIRRGNG